SPLRSGAVRLRLVAAPARSGERPGVSGPGDGAGLAHRARTDAGTDLDRLRDVWPVCLGARRHRFPAVPAPRVTGGRARGKDAAAGLGAPARCARTATF